MRAFLFAKKSEEELTKLKVKGISIEIARCTDFESAIESTSEFTALTQALDEVNKVMEAYSDENIMGKIMSMDGEGCGLDADLLDGKHGSEYATAAQGEKADSAIQNILGEGKIIIPNSNNSVSITPENIGAVPKNRTVNKKELSSDITLSYSDVGAASNEQGTKADSAIQGIRGNGTAILPDENRIVNITPENIEAVPITRTINEKALSSNITINALDIGAASIEQGNKADSAIQSIQGNGKIIQPDFNHSVVITPENMGAVPAERKINDKALDEDITLSASDIGAAAIEHGEHVPSVQAADNSVFLRNDNSWQPVTPENIGAASEEQGQKADYAIQGIQVNGVHVSPDLNRYVNVTIEDLEAVPKERKINNKSLESDVSLTAADVGAAEIIHSHTPQEIGAATSEQGSKADSAVQGVKLNGNLLVLDDENVVDIEVSEVSGATAAQGAKADSAIQGVKLNGSLITPDDENVVDIEVSEFGGATAEQGAKADSAVQGVKLDGTLLEADSQNIVDIIVSESSTATYEAEISTNWETAETGEYVQSVEVAGILATDNPIVDVVLDASKDAALSQLESWSCVSKIETSDGSITVTCLEETPTVTIPI